MIYFLKVTHSTSTAHKITGHPGECANLHGHNYNFEIVFGSNSLGPLGMVRDFGPLKKEVKAFLDKHFDHKTIIYKKDPDAKLYKDLGAKLVPYNPTAENMAEFVYRELRKLLMLKVQVVSVIVEETQNNKAIYGECL